MGGIDALFGATTIESEAGHQAPCLTWASSGGQSHLRDLEAQEALLAGPERGSHSRKLERKVSWSSS